MNASKFILSLFGQKNESNAHKDKAKIIDKSILEKSITILKMYFEEKQAWKTRNLKIKDLIDELHVNRTYVWLIVKHVTGKNFNDYVNAFRIEEAKHLLENFTTKDTIEDIVTSVGFNSYNTFSRAFKKVTGTTPSNYIEQHKNKKR